MACRHYCYIILFGEVDPVLLQLSAGWQICWALDSQVVDCWNVPGTCDLGHKRCLSKPKSHWYQLCSNMWCGSVSIKSVAGNQLWKPKFFFYMLKDWKVWRMMLLLSHADWWCSRLLELLVSIYTLIPILSRKQKSYKSNVKPFSIEDKRYTNVCPLHQKCSQDSPWQEGVH